MRHRYRVKVGYQAGGKPRAADIIVRATCYRSACIGADKALDLGLLLESLDEIQADPPTWGAVDFRGVAVTFSFSKEQSR